MVGQRGSGAGLASLQHDVLREIGLAVVREREGAAPQQRCLHARVGFISQDNIRLELGPDETLWCFGPSTWSRASVERLNQVLIPI